MVVQYHKKMLLTSIYNFQSYSPLNIIDLEILQHVHTQLYTQIKTHTDHRLQKIMIENVNSKIVCAKYCKKYLVRHRKECQKTIVGPQLAQ